MIQHLNISSDSAISLLATMREHLVALKKD
jgi:hypothetical protein